MKHQSVLKIILLSLITASVYADTIPIGNNNAALYYKIGGGSDYSLPPVSDTTPIDLDIHADVGLGYSCSGFNPALSITNSFNSLKEDFNNLSNTIIQNVRASIIQLPGYVTSLLPRKD
jgi:hypothetical protein